jgi:hypothetical protein
MTLPIEMGLARLIGSETVEHFAASGMDGDNGAGPQFSREGAIPQSS